MFVVNLITIWFVAFLLKVTVFQKQYVLYASKNHLKDKFMGNELNTSLRERESYCPMKLKDLKQFL